MRNTYRLVISCPDRCGIVSAVSAFIKSYQGFILEADHHSDVNQQRFFMRYEIAADNFQLTTNDFKQCFAKIADEFNMVYSISHSLDKARVLLLVSKKSHCLEEILYRWTNQQLYCDIVGVFSNHADLSHRAADFNLPFHHVSVANKQDHFAQLAALVTELQVDLLVLARYMQVIPVSLCAQLAGKMINIHHSFLPSFVGARPYKQAYDRGVKLIGATAHYVTGDLDQGPIIDQNVIAVNHRKSLDDFIRLGESVERSVLADALQAHLQDKVIIHDKKTIVFN